MAKPWEKNYGSAGVSASSGRKPWEKNYGAEDEEEKLVPEYAPKLLDRSLPPPAAEENGFFRNRGDDLLAFASGVTGVVKAGTDLFGADNAASKYLDKNSRYIADQYSDEQKARLVDHSQRMADAEATGSMWEEAKAGVGNFLDDPNHYTAQGLGSTAAFAPLALVAPEAAVGGVGLRAAGQLALGAGLGVGAVKGQQYEQVKEAMLKEGYSPEQAEAAAVKAQAYDKDNAVDLLAGGALGAVAGRFGAEGAMLGTNAASMAGKKLLGRAVTGILTEAPMEALQGGQERLAANRAMIREGYELDPWQGVIGQATTEGLASAGPGAGFAMYQGYTPTQAEIEADTQRAAEGERIRAEREAQQQAVMAEQQRVAEEAARQEGLVREKRKQAAQLLPFPEFEAKFKEEEKVRREQTKALTEEAKAQYGAALVEDPTLDQKSFVKQYLESHGVTGEKVDVRDAYLKALDETDMGTDLLGDPVDLKPEEAAAEEAPAGLATNRRQMDFLDELDRTASPDYRPVMPVADRPEGNPVNTTFTQTPVTDTLPGALDLAKKRAETAQTAHKTARDVIQEAGPTLQGKWAGFVSKHKLAGADIETIAQTVRDAKFGGVDADTLADEMLVRANPNAAPVQTTPAGEVKLDLPAEDAAPAEDTRDAEKAIVSRMFDKLSDRQRQILSLYHFDKMPFEAIGQQMAEADGRDTAYTRAYISQEHKRAKAKLLEFGASLGLTEERLNTYFPDESVRLSGGADVQTASAAQVAQMGAAMHVPGGVDNAPSGDLDGAIDEVNSPDVVVDEDGNTTATAYAETSNLDIGQGADEFTDDDTGDGQVPAEETVDFDLPAQQSVNWTDHTGQPIQQIDIADAAEDYNSELQEGDVAFEQLSEADRARYVKAYIAAMDKAISSQQLMNIFSEIADGAKQKTAGAEPVRVAEEAAAVGQVQGKLQAGNAPEKQAAAPEVKVVRRKKKVDAAALSQPAASDPDMDLITSLRLLSRSDKHKVIAADFLKRAQLGEDVKDEAQAWVDAVNGDVLESSANGRTIGQDATKLRETMRGLFARPDLFDKRVTVVQSEDEVPANFTRSKPTQKASKRLGFYDPNSGRVWLIADNIPKGREFGVLLHEVGGHMGMLNLLGKANYDRLVSQIDQWIENNDGTIESRIALAADSRVSDAERALGRKLDKRTRDDELIAYFVEEAVYKGVMPEAIASQPATMQQWFRTLWNAVKSAVLKLGINPKTLTARDVVDLAYGAARLQLSGKDVDINAANAASGRPASEVYEDNGEVMDSLTSSVVDAAPEPLKEPVNRIIDSVVDVLQKGANYSVFTEYLIDRVKDVLPSAEAWYRSIKQRETMRISHEAKIDQVAEMVDKLSQAEFNRSWTLVRDMTKAEKWGYQPEWRGDVIVDPEMAARYEALSAPEQDLIDAVFKNGSETIRETQAALDKIAEDVFAERLAAAKTDKTREKLTRDKAKFKRMFSRKLSEMQGPYAPMRRVGNYVTVGKSQQFADLQAKVNKGQPSQADLDQLEELRGQEAHYSVVFSDTKAEALAEERNMKAAYDVTSASPKEYFAKNDHLPFQAFESLRQSAMADEDTNAKLMQMIDDLYLTSLADTSARKSELRRSGTAGLTADTMYKAFLSKGKADAHYLAILKTHRDVSDSFGAMRSEGLNYEGGDRSAKMEALNELKKRYENSFNFDPSPAIGKLMNLTATWMLLTKPAYYAYNLTQPLMMTQPWLSQTHGYNRSFAAMTTAYKDMLSSQKTLKGAHWDLAAMPEDVRGMLNQLRDSGHIDITIAQDLGQRMHSSGGKVSAYASRVNSFLRHAASKTEMANRIVTAVAAYRLALNKGETEENALKYARMAVSRTQGDYSNFNAPRLMNQTSFQKLVTQFRKFQFIQAGMLIRMVRDSFGGNKYEAAAARRSVAALLGHHALMAGAVGLPLFNVVAMAFSAAGDEDEPKDLELWIKQQLGDDFLGTLLTSGLPAAAMNINVSQNLGMGQTFSVMPFAEVKLTKEGYAGMVTAAMGPTIGGLGSQATVAMGKLADGDYFGGLADLAPSIVKTTYKAFSEASRGVENKRGDVLVDPAEIHEFATIAKALGFKTQTDHTRQLVRGAQIEFEAFFAEHAAEIRRKYTKAYRDGDRAELQELRQRWMNLQGFKREYGFKAQGLDKLLSAPADQRKRERATRGGVQFTNANRGFVLDVAGDDADE